jgi:hypothetical protein
MKKILKVIVVAVLFIGCNGDVNSNQSPTIKGLLTTQKTEDNRSIALFSKVTLEDKENDNISVSITLKDKEQGSLSTDKIKTNSISSVETALRAVLFIPTKNRLEVGKSEKVTILLTLDDGFTTTTKSTVVVVTSLNDKPTDIELSSYRVKQSEGVDAIVGKLSSIDMDKNETFIYSLVSGKGDANNKDFHINGDELRTDPSTLLDAGVYSIRVNTNDGESDFSKELNITVIDDTTLEKIAIDIECETSTSISEYIALVKGDTIIKGEENTTISIFHDENNQKRVCLNAGEAYIERKK